MKCSAARRLFLAILPVVALSPLHGAHANGNGQSASDGSFFSDQSNPLSQDFQFKSGLQMQTGPQRVDQSGALFSNSYDGARSANLSDSAERYRLQLFGYQNQPTVRYDGLSVNYIPAKYNSGASLQLNDMRQWTVQSGFFTSNESMGAALNEPQISTWNVSAGRRWIDDSVFTRMEYARSQNDNYVSPGLADHAIDMRMDIRSPDWIRLSWFDDWKAGMHYRSVGAAYTPAAEVFLPSGLDEANVFFKSAIRDFTFDIGQREQSQKAIDTMGVFANTESRSMASVTYTPAVGKDNVLRRALGKPSLTAHYHKINEVRPGFDSDGRVQDKPLLNQLDEQGIALALAKPFLNWSLEYQESYLRPRATGREQRSIASGDRNATLLSVGVKPSKKVSVTANAQQRRQLADRNSQGNSQQLYNVAANFDVVPNTISLSMQYDHAYSSGPAFNAGTLNWGFDNQVGSAALSWRAITFHGSRPAMDLSFKSSYGKIGDQLAMNVDERWSAQLAMKMYWGQQQL